MRNTTFVDRVLESVLHAARTMPSLTLGAQLLGESARGEGQRQALYALPQTTALEAAIRRGDAAATRVFDEVVADALAGMRNAPTRGLAGVLSSIDRLSRSEAPERCDDETLAKPERQAILECVTWLNEELGFYDTFLVLAETDLAPRTGPVRVLELAAGRGELALALKDRFGDAVDVVATDLSADYLELGCASAVERGLEVAFMERDALDLHDVADDAFDVVVCTQSLHHFSPGQVARLLAEASRVASRAVWLVDGERTLVGAAALGGAVALHTGSWNAVHDTVVSLRKMYTEEELGLLASLAPGMPEGWKVETGRLGPGFVFVTARPREEATPLSVVETEPGSRDTLVSAA